VGFVIQIKPKKGFVIPPEAGYVPANPEYPEMLGFSGSTMSILVHFMAGVDVVDLRIIHPRQVSETREGRVPHSKFIFNDGNVVEPREATAIADALSKHDLFSHEFLQAHVPKLLEPTNAEILASAKELLPLWIAFNRVAAANNGYTVH
jgi:hypothetical protein